MRPRALLAWSSGKDAAFALHELRRNGELDVVGLFTTVTGPCGRVAMHGTRRELLTAQAAAAGLPLRLLEIPDPCPNEVYEAVMADFVAEAASRGIRAVVFGDLFLDDIRRYREDRLAGTGLTPVFPLWGRPTAALAREMIAAGLAAHLVCLDPKRIDRSLAGARFDQALLAALPPEVDPCGENGEFHTAVVGGPVFRAPIAVECARVEERAGFVRADLRLV